MTFLSSPINHLLYAQFLYSAPSEWKDIWNNLMKEAQRVYIEAKDNMIMYQYYYDLAVEVPCV